MTYAQMASIWLTKYKAVSTNQHVTRYKLYGTTAIRVGQLSADCTDADGLARLIRIGHMLNAPVHYDYEASIQRAYIDIVSAEAVREVPNE